MSEAAEILVIILSIFLALFLLLATILVVILIKVSRQIKSIAESTQVTVDHIQGIAANTAKFSSPALIGKFVFDQIKKFRK
ncbi:MAG: hypothetical protein WAW60_00520 [Candidatus Saccharimonadales bacterium]